MSEIKCPICQIKGEMRKGTHYNEFYKIDNDENIPLFHLNEILCDFHYNIFQNYVKKFNWKKISGGEGK